MRGGTHCRRGHEYTVDNTIWTVWNGRRARVCRACRTMTMRQYKQLNRVHLNAKTNERINAHNGLPPGDPRHGTANGYSYWRCRCADCYAAVLDRPRTPRPLSLDLLAERRFGMDRINLGSEWDDPVFDAVVELVG